MKIAIIGYGKMGKTIEHLALEQGHEIVLKIDAGNRNQLTASAIEQADVAIEFTQPDTAFHNIKFCLEHQTPIVSGTTAWLEQMDEVQKICLAQKGAFFYASNYSVGVNIFFAINRKLAQMMNSHAQYNIEMEEIHHTQKLDAPSGTAISLAEGILDEVDRKKQWTNELSSNANDLAIVSKRIDKVPGTHQIAYNSSVDTIEITHIAHSREGFARGALLAAEWLIGKEGCFGMKDLLGF